MEVLRRLGKLFSSQNQTASSHSPGVDYSDQPIDQMLEGIDRNRVAREAAAKAARVKQQQAEAEALQRELEQARSWKATTVRYLAFTDAVITEGLLVIARRTWREDGVELFKSSPSLENVDYAVRTTDTYPIHGSRSCSFDYDVYRKDPVLSIRSTPSTESHRGYQFSPKYGLILEFKNGKPNVLRACFGAPVLSLSGQDFETDKFSSALNRMLVEYYRAGPTLQLSGED